MPRLPSGREVVLDTGPLEALLKTNESDPVPTILTDVRTVEDVEALVRVSILGPPGPGQGRVGSEDPRSHPWPEGLVPYPSGHTLATVDALTAGWPPGDVAAFNAFLAEPRVRGYLAEALERVRASNRRRIVRFGEYAGLSEAEIASSAPGWVGGEAPPWRH